MLPYEASWLHLRAVILPVTFSHGPLCAGAGVQVQVGKLTGFLPYKLLDPTRLPQRKPDGGLPPVPARGYQELVGRPVKVKVTQVGGGSSSSEGSRDAREAGKEDRPTRANRQTLAQAGASVCPGAACAQNRPRALLEAAWARGAECFGACAPSRLCHVQAPPPSPDMLAAISPFPSLPCQVIVPEKRLIVSEKAVLLEELANIVAVGDVIEGVIGNITDFGAFVEVLSREPPPPRAAPRSRRGLPLLPLLRFHWNAQAGLCCQW